MNTKILVWQKIFFIMNVIAFLLLPLTIILNAGLVLFGLFFLMPVEAGLHALIIILGIIILFCFRKYKENIPPKTLKTGLILFLVILNTIVLAVGSFLAYFLATILK